VHIKNQVGTQGGAIYKQERERERERERETSGETNPTDILISDFKPPEL
jgi:hypothetical protein